MCLVLTAWRAHPAYLLVVAANRDEFYERRTAPLDWWRDEPEVLAGRDLDDAGAGGTWMGVARCGRFAVVTNVREPADIRAGAFSRGELPARYLGGQQPPREFLDELATRDGDYNGFNLLLSDRRQASDELLPDTGIPLEWERLLSSAFIASPGYGTRSSTVLRVRHDGSFDIAERSFDPDGATGERYIHGMLNLQDG
ncbi:MAG: NRDE family protein [Pseudonocardiaceae bacterium]